MNWIENLILTAIAGGLVSFEKSSAQKSTYHTIEPIVHFAVESIDPRYSVNEHQPTSLKYGQIQSNSKPIPVSISMNVNGEKIIFWEENKQHSNPSPVPADASSLARIKIKFTCAANYFTKWNFQSHCGTVNEQDYLDMTYSLDFKSRALESPLPNVLNKNEVYNVPTQISELTIHSFGTQFKSITIDCENYSNNTIKTGIYIFQRSAKLDPFCKDNRGGNKSLALSPDVIFPCSIHDPDLIPTLSQLNTWWMTWEKKYTFVYDWKLGFRRQYYKLFYDGDRFQCEVNKRKLEYKLLEKLKTSSNRNNIIMELASSESDSQGDWAIACRITDELNARKNDQSIIRLSSMQIESCVSPDYCQFRRDAYNIDIKFKNCTLDEQEKCTLKKPLLIGGDQTQLDLQGKVTCFVQIDQEIYASYDHYFQGISGKFYLLSHPPPSLPEEMLQIKLDRPTPYRKSALVSCTALNFFSVAGSIKFSITFVNETVKIVEGSPSSFWRGTTHGLENLQVILTYDFLSVNCHAPWFNSTQWATVSHVVTTDDIEGTSDIGTPTVISPAVTTEEPRNTDNSSADDSTDHAAIIVPCIIIALLIILAGWFIHRYYIVVIECLLCPANSKSEIETYELLDLNSIDTNTKHSIPQKNLISSKDISVDYSKIVSGGGQFSTLYQGCLKIGATKSKRSVLVKVNKIAGDAKEISALLNDVQMRTIAGDTNPHIASILGASFDRTVGKVCIAMKSGTTRSIRDFLTNENMPMGQLKILNMPPHEMKQTFHVWLQGVSKGLEFLHSKKIVHGNIAAENILVCFQNTELVSITGFSHSQQLTEKETYFVKSRSWTCGWETSGWRWMPMESLRYMEFSKESDVWSFGVLMWEIFSLGAIPYSKLGYLKLSMEFIQKLEFGVRLGQPQLASKEMYRKMEACWSRYGKDRPKPKELSRFFNEDPSNCVNYINLVHQK